MSRHLKRIVRFYAGWRLPLVVLAFVLGYVGLSTDGWWSPLVALAGFVPLLVIYALTASRVGDHDTMLTQHDTRLAASEDRLGHAEARDVSYEAQIEAANKRIYSTGRRIEKAEKSAAKAEAFAIEPPAGGSKPAAKAPSTNQNVVTGQVMSLYNIATGSDVAPDAPLVTVVVPAFNEARFIRDTIESLKAQTFTNFVAVVVDDASSDDTVAKAFAAIGGDNRFHVVRHAINSGLSAGRNTGLRLAETPYVCFLDGDDFFHPDNLEERVRYLVGFTDDDAVVGVYSGIEHVDEHVRFGEVDGASPAKHRARHFDHLNTAGEAPFNCHAPMLRTDVLQRFGGFDESMRHGAEDWECWQRIMRHGYFFRSTPNIQAVYRQKAASMVRSMPGEHLGEAERLLRRTHEPLDPADIVPGTPYVFTEPLGHYQHKLQMTERVLSYMGMSYMTEDPEQLDAAFDQIDAKFWPVVKRNLNASAKLDVGIRRGFSLDPVSFRHLGGKIHPIREALLERLEKEADEAKVEAVDAVVDGPDIVFVPETAAQARSMVDVATTLAADIDVVMLEVNMISGASGVTEVLDDAWTGARQTLNTWSLSGAAAKAVVVQWPYGPTASSVLEHAATAGSITVELGSDDVYRLEETTSVSCDKTANNAADLTSLISGVDRTTLGVMERSYDVNVAALAAVEEYPRLPADIGDIEQFHNKHVGERCVIIGNGPSLNDLELGRLRNENTIGVNGIFYAEAINFPLTYYVVEDTSVMNENQEAIKKYAAGHKFFPTIYRKSYGEVDVEEGSRSGVTYFTMNRGFYAKESPNFCVPRFSTDASQRLYCGQSVTIINLQLAYYMGFSEVYLIGMDFSYTIPDSAKVEGDLITSTEDDVNHFHKDYFGKGKTWKDPKLDRVMNNYQLAKVMFEADGRNIYNATAGGKLEVFERRDFHDTFAG